MNRTSAATMTLVGVISDFLDGVPGRSMDCDPKIDDIVEVYRRETGIRTKAAAALEKQALAYEAMDDNSGAFFIAETVNTVWSFRDRFWNQIQRQSGGEL